MVTHGSLKVQGVISPCSLNSFHSQDLINNSPYCLLYNSYGVSVENLELDKLVP